MGLTYFPNGVDTAALTASSAVVSGAITATGNVEAGTLTIGGVAATPATTTALTIQTKEVTFTEAGAGTYTGTVAIPAGATVLDVIWRNTVLWTNGTSASLVVGDDDDANGYIEATDVKAAPLADVNGAAYGFSSRSSLGASIGTYKGGGGKYCAAAKTITATVVAGAGAQTAGRSRLLVTYAVPVVSAATKA